MLPDGQTLSSGFLLDLTYRLFLDFPGAVSAFCLVQDDPARWRLEVVPAGQWSSEIGDKLIAELGKSVGQPMVKLELAVVEAVTKTASGKANPIISRVKK